MTLSEQMSHFSTQFGKTVVINNTTWHYYRIGAGPSILWLTGGLRRAGLGFPFIERLARRHTVIAPDYPPVKTIGEYFAAFDAILLAEGVGSFVLGGQSYGGLLAQAYLAHKGRAVEQLVLSSSGPADYSKAWLPVEYITIALAYLLPVKLVKNILAGGLIKMITLPEAQRTEWVAAIVDIIQKELARADVISHFAVAADLIKRGLVSPGAFKNWRGPVVVLSAENDPTQSKKDIPRYEKLFGRRVTLVNMGEMGHTAALFNPDKYVELLEEVLVSTYNRTDVA